MTLTEEEMHRISFFLYIPKKALDKGGLYITKNPDNVIISDKMSNLLFITEAFKNVRIKNLDIYIGGDPIYEGNIGQLIIDENINMPNILKKIKGHFYLIVWDGNAQRLFLSPSLFNMFPVFYLEDDKCFMAASHLALLSSFTFREFRLNKKYVLEQFLFNYPLFNDTMYSGVKLLESNCHVSLDKKLIKINKHLSFKEFCFSNPENYLKKADYLTDLFISGYESYIPESKHYISFTGGFDGRTLTSCAHYYNSNFRTFSFGSKKNSDVMIPLLNSKKVDINFTPLFLDTCEYIDNEFLKTGKKLVSVSSGYSNFLYVHSLYSAKILSKQTDYILSGYFGSELFRALHLSGGFCSKELVSFFHDKEDDWIKNIKKSPKLDYLNHPLFGEALEETIEDLIAFKKELSNFETHSQFFYKYVMDEIFRKIFGPQLFAQFDFLNVRTPYLDYFFIKELFKTELAGVNNPFFVQNPVKRFKGQFLYAKIINKTFPELSKVKTQKGYAPIDLLSPLGKIKIVIPFVLKRLNRKIAKPYLDNLAIISGFNSNQKYFFETTQRTDLFNIYRLKNLISEINTIPEIQRDLLILSASISEFKLDMGL